MSFEDVIIFHEWRDRSPISFYERNSFERKVLCLKQSDSYQMPSLRGWRRGNHFQI